MNINDEESLTQIDWFRMGESDLVDAQILRDEGRTDDIGVLIHSALEKYLKGLLLGYGWKITEQRQLAELLKAAVEYEPALIEHGGLMKRLDRRFLTYEQKGVISEVNAYPVSEALQDAENFIRILRRLVSSRMKTRKWHKKV